ncbi:MAG: transketolase [Clostridia bacterium]|nr:transketolase [Clostridia bacterium]
MTQTQKKQLETLAAQIRLDILAETHAAKSGHPGGSLSIADLMAYLYTYELHVDPKNPHDPDRDRLVLSKGHTAPALYSILARKGFFPAEDLITLRKIDSDLQGHPDMKKTPGVDMTSGSLGQGLSAACGMAWAAKKDGKTYRCYAIVGDGESQEGQIWEACMFASHYKLDNLCMILDWNGLQIDGAVEEIMNPTPYKEKLESFGFHVVTIDGHDFDQIEAALNEAKTFKGAPTAIIMKTIKGKGVSYMENQAGWHGNAPNDELYAKGVEEILAAHPELR